MKIILEDTRQQMSKHEHVNRWLMSHGITIRRTKLYVGDYTLPTEQSVCVDTKYGLQEVYGNVIQDHERFRAELIAAQEAGIRLVVLVEESGIRAIDDVKRWNNPRMKRYNRMTQRMQEAQKPPVPSDRLAKIMHTMAEKYGVEWRFCDKADTARIICEILGIEVESNV